MKCEEFQSHFPDYLDKFVEAPRARGIENHLTNCPICREEFSGLRECRQLVASLPLVEPPLGFTTRVMARVTEAANETSFWKRFFVPLRVKIPLQATAVMLIGILSFYVYQKEDRHNLQQPTVAETPAPLNADGAESQRATLPPPVVELRQPQPARRPVNEAARAESVQATVSANAAPPMALSDSQLQTGSSARRSMPIPAQGIVAGAGLSGPMGMAREPAFRFVPAQREITHLGEPVADYEFYVTVGLQRERPQETPASAPQKGAKGESSSLNAETKRQADLQAAPVLDVLWYSVPQDRYEQFKSELAAQARIESEIPVGIKEKDSSFRSDRPLFIKVMVLAPNP